MTREEEIREAASAFFSSYFLMRSYIYGPIDCFKEGVKWADNHPKNIWHDANEMPTENNKSIIYQTNYCSMYNVNITFIPTCLRSCKITSSSWNEFVEEVNMRRWAYTDDLLPKGGEK